MQEIGTLTIGPETVGPIFKRKVLPCEFSTLNDFFALIIPVMSVFYDHM